eukprot:753820-Hanusia_phi.AAC.2
MTGENEEGRVVDDGEASRVRPVQPRCHSSAVGGGGEAVQSDSRQGETNSHACLLECLTRGGAGDYITLSGKPGVGMQAERH